MRILKKAKKNHKGYMEVLTTPHIGTSGHKCEIETMRTQAFGGWTHWKRDWDHCWADEGWKGNSVDLGPKPSRGAASWIVLVTLRGCVEDVSGSVRKTASWNQLVLLEQATIAEKNCSGEADWNRKELSFFLLSIVPLTSPIAEPNRNHPVGKVYMRKLPLHLAAPECLCCSQFW